MLGVRAMIAACLSTCGAFVFADIPREVLLRANSVALIKSCGNQPNTMKVGSCSYLGEGYWLTNRHVLCQCGRAEIVLRRGGRVQGLVVERAAEDLAIVKSQPVDLSPIPLADSPPGPNDAVYPIGYDSGKEPLGTWPSVRLFDDSDPREIYVGTGERKGTVSGNSGGPILNAMGQLVAPLRGNTDPPTRGLGTTVGVGFYETRDFLKRVFGRRQQQVQQNCPDGQCPAPGAQRIIPSTPIPPITQLGGGSDLSRSAPSEVDIAPVDIAPQVVDIDYEKIARQLLPMLAEDERFRGPPGPPGPPGESGEPIDMAVLVSRVKKEVADSIRYRVIK